MTNLRQAAQQALEALEIVARQPVGARTVETITALRAALAEPEQKPVAWTDGRGFIASHADSFPRGTTVSPLYAHPPTPRKPVELTNEELLTIYTNHVNDEKWGYERAVIAAYKAKQESRHE